MDYDSIIKEQMEELDLAELETHSHAAGWVDVCKGWTVHEGTAQSA